MLSIIVLDHDRPDLTEACLESLCQSKVSEQWQLIVVDNGSKMEIEPRLRAFQGRIKRLTCLRNDSNLSFAQANNAASAKCEGDWLLFLNNDVCLSEGTINRLLAARDRRADAGIIGGKLLYPATGRVQHAGMVQMLWGYASNYGVGGRADDPRLNHEREIFAVTGALLCVERGLFERLGGFDEAFWYGYEDVDLCLNARDLGRKVIYAASAQAFHLESATTGEQRDSRVFNNNYARFRQKWGGILEVGEKALLRKFGREGIRRVAVFGTGIAAEGLTRELESDGIQVAAFTCSGASTEGNGFLGKPVVPLEQIPAFDLDRLMVGTQSYFEVEELIQRFVPVEQLVFPTVA